MIHVCMIYIPHPQEKYEAGWSLMDTDHDGLINKRSCHLVLDCVYVCAFVWCGV
jgi:hypothetical protein